MINKNNSHNYYAGYTRYNKCMKISKVYIYVIIVILLTLYCCIFCILPVILNSSFMVRKYQVFLESKFSVPVVLKNFHFATNPDLTFSVYIGKLEIGSGVKAKGALYNKNKVFQNNVLSIKNLEIGTKFMSPKPKTIMVDRIYVDVSELKKHMAHNNKTQKSKLNLSYFPIMTINKIYLKLDEKGAYAEFYDIKSEKKAGKIYCLLSGKVFSPILSNPIIIGTPGQIYYDDKLYFDNFTVLVNDSKLYINGRIDDLDVIAKGIPVRDAEYVFLHYYKFKHPNKKNFIENFQNFKGVLDVDLNFSSSGVHGKCFAKNLGADFSKYNIPIDLPLVIFNFEGRKLSAKTNGTFGTEPVYTDVYLSAMATDDVDIKGSVSSTLTGRFSQKYFKPVKIIGSAPAFVKYHVHKNKVNIDYILMVEKGSNLIYDFGSLDNIDKVRKISAHTLKQGDNIYLKDYSYEILRNDKNFEKLVFGHGMFAKQNRHYKPVYLAVKTNGYLDFSVIKSFIKNSFESGTFKVDLKYDFFNKHLSGYIKLKEVQHKDFLLFNYAEAEVFGNLLKMNASGLFLNSPIKIGLLAESNFKTGFLIRDIDIKLNKFYLKRGYGMTDFSTMSYVKKDFSSRKSRGYNVTVEKGRIHVGEIIHQKFSLNDVEILGKLNNSIVEFIIPQTVYAKGILSATGKYDIETHSSDIHFLASDIDSNEVASKIFNLPNQIEGFAYATLHLVTKDKLKDIKAFATFAVHDGFLPKLGSKEFIVNRSDKKGRKLLFFLKKPFKFTLSKISNIDFSKPSMFYSNLRGSFTLCNDEIKDAKIFSQSDYLSLFIEGSYNISAERGKVYIYGKHNKAADRKIRIFKLPLSLIYKLLFKAEHTKSLYLNKIKMIPPIKAEPDDIGIFRVILHGNLNNNDIKVHMKDLR